MNVIAAAGGTGDVGRKFGFDMSEGWGMILAAAFTGLFVLLAAVIAYKAGRRQVADQARVEHRSWRRQHRLDAYQQLIRAADEFSDSMEQWKKSRAPDRNAIGQAVDKMVLAEVAVRLVGPEHIHAPARDVVREATELDQYANRPISTMVPIPLHLLEERVQKLNEPLRRFITEAAEVLDDPDQ
ncbi:hypothetical protein [Streptomyces iranensis]|uniref:hypothetical protein n=1 Tax=Streptomyces iranensis TaxID=576784 RepID=UPI0039B76992